MNTNQEFFEGINPPKDQTLGDLMRRVIPKPVKATVQVGVLGEDPDKIDFSAVSKADFEKAKQIDPNFVIEDKGDIKFIETVKKLGI